MFGSPIMNAVLMGGRVATSSGGPTFDYDLTVPGTGGSPTFLDNTSDGDSTITLLTGSTANSVGARSTEAAARLCVPDASKGAFYEFGSYAGQNIVEVGAGVWGVVATGAPCGIAIVSGANKGALAGWMAYLESASGLIRVINIAAGLWTDFTDLNPTLFDIVPSGAWRLRYVIDVNQLYLVKGDGTVAAGPATPTTPRASPRVGFLVTGQGVGGLYGVAGNNLISNGAAT